MEIKSYLCVKDDRRGDYAFLRSFFVDFIPHEGKTVRNEVQTVGFGVFSVGFKECSLLRTVSFWWRMVKTPRQIVRFPWGKVFPKWHSGGVLRCWGTIGTIPDFNISR